MKKTLTRSKLGLNKDSLRRITDDQLREVIGGSAGAGGGGTLHTVSATCSEQCQPLTIILDQGTCK